MGGHVVVYHATMEAEPAFISPPVVTRFRHSSRIGGLVVALTGLLGLAGWALDIAVLKSVHPSWATMKANTAACFALLGISVWLFGHGAHAGRRIVVRLFALIALL